MNEKEVIEQLKSIIDDFNRGNDFDLRVNATDVKSLRITLQLLEQKDNRIDELEKALVDEDFKHKEKIEELESELYNANCIIDDYIEERKHLNGGINKLMAKRKKWKNRYYKTKAKLYQIKNKLKEDEKTCIDSNIILKILEK